MEEVGFGHEVPFEHHFGCESLGLYLDLEVQFFLLALEADGDELLMDSIELKEGVSIEQFPYILHPIVIDDIWELFLFDGLEFDVHVAKLTDRLDSLVSHALYDGLEVEVLFGRVVPVVHDGFGLLQVVLVWEDDVGVVEELLSDDLIWGGVVEFFQFGLFLDLFPFEFPFVLLVLGD